MRNHWPEYAIEALCLGLFMVSAAAFATLLQHPASPVASWLGHQGIEPTVARVPMGVAMGLTAMALIYSPLGRRSGAHMNPAVTLAFAFLGKVGRRDAVGYVVAQFAGGATGILAALWLLDGLPADGSVNYVATLPGKAGWGPAAIAELVMSFLMMSTVLTMSARRSTERFTGVAAGFLVATFITVEAPLSGMSMNPARTLTANLLAGDTSSLWIYFAAPLAGMLASAGVFSRCSMRGGGLCAKLRHTDEVRCIFCGHVPSPTTRASTTSLSPEPFQ